eukprot:CAMPEP_0198730470 /NCGR_PEP_ID=MMETSP1475-20131203/24676_1 /TAXON_ID= ORGANISM="Unidentified sp., Strain CCMP1999" /NCGR_SAMPLE_ID=MMETSP1475 /ASSEMBLY_ACC=CAM_ASM_001111 /LENGTH=217 /DNA_ID=CAMNT_0044493281 /DNA_START=60 /DNA_END=709 /DNA_ORIENTATION=+
MACFRLFGGQMAALQVLQTSQPFRDRCIVNLLVCELLLFLLVLRFFAVGEPAADPSTEDPTGLSGELFLNDDFGCLLASCFDKSSCDPDSTCLVLFSPLQRKSMSCSTSRRSRPMVTLPLTAGFQKRISRSAAFDLCFFMLRFSLLGFSSVLASSSTLDLGRRYFLMCSLSSASSSLRSSSSVRDSSRASSPRLFCFLVNLVSSSVSLEVVSDTTTS